VIVASARIGRIEPVGAMEWRGFISAVALVAERVYSRRPPPTRSSKACAPRHLNPKVQVVTVLMPVHLRGLRHDQRHKRRRRGALRRV